MRLKLFNYVKENVKILPYLFLILILGMWFSTLLEPTEIVYAEGRAIVGYVIDEQGQPVKEVEVALYVDGDEEPLAEGHSQDDGSFIILLSEVESLDGAVLEFQRPHYDAYEQALNEAEISLLLSDTDSVALLDDITLARHFQLSFWLTAVTFVGMLALIATERLHKTLAALLAVSVLFAVSLVGGFLNKALFIYDFEQSIEYVDFDVIFLLMGMMIIIGIIEETGIFQWLAYQSYKLSRGKVWLLTIILIIITAVASALLDNVTTMLLMTPITLKIAMAMKIDPLSLLLPEILASNIGGISTLVGTPTNILIGSYAGLSFNDFLINQTIGVVMALAGLIAYVLWKYRKEHQSVDGGISKSLLKLLEADAQISDPKKLLKAGIVFAVVLFLFVIGESIHLPPAVTAIMGAVAMLIWVHPDIEGMMGVVDWTTLMFFISLFMVIGAVQEVGLIFIIANQIGVWVGNNLLLAMLVIVWLAAIMSGIVDNIPFAAAMLPVVDYLTRNIPGADSMVLFYALSIGAAMGGNTSLIGASANLVTAGISSRAGYPISFKAFFVTGFPAMLITVTLGSLWLYLRFF